MRPTLIAFTLRLLVSTFDLIADWLLYYEVSGLKQGLVFGPFSDAVLGLFVFFGCIGTVTYIVEIVLNVIDFFAAKDDVLPNGFLDNVNLVSLWIEDVPLILMSVYIAGCRDTAVTILMLVKALSTLLEVFVNVGIIITEYILNKQKTAVIKFGEKETAKWLKIPLGISLFIMMIGSILVFGLGNYYTDSKNVIQLSSPLDVNFGKYNKLNYLYGSGIYLNFDNGQTDVVTMDTHEWIALIDLESITSTKSSSFMVRVTYDSNPNTRLWIQSSSSYDLTSPESSTCYSTQTSPLSILTSCSTDLQMTSNAKSIVFKFVYESPSNSKPLGDIYYNYGVAPIEITKHCFLPEATPEFSLSYFKITSYKHNSNHLMTLSNVSGNYYKSGSDLQDVSEAWRTGQFGCGHTGRSIPKLETSISVPCLVWDLEKTLSTSPTSTSTLYKTTSTAVNNPTTFTTSVVNNSTLTVNTTTTTPATVTLNTTTTTAATNVTVNTTTTTADTNVTVNTTTTTTDTNVTVNTTTTTTDTNVNVNTTTTTAATNVTVNTTTTTADTNVTVNTTTTTTDTNVNVNTTTAPSATNVTVNTTTTTTDTNVNVNTTTAPSATNVTVNTTTTTAATNVTVNTTTTTPPSTSRKPFNVTATPTKSPETTLTTSTITTPTTSPTTPTTSLTTPTTTPTTPTTAPTTPTTTPTTPTTTPTNPTTSFAPR